MEGFSRSVLLCLFCIVSQSNANNAPEIDVVVYNVCEDTPVGATAFTIVASDVENDPLTFSLSEVNAGYFTVEGTTGRVIVNRELDAESNTVMPLGVVVSDGSTSTSRDLTVVLGDTNDNKPIFQEASYDYEFAENTPVGSSLFRMNATDADSSTAGVVKYSIDEVTPSSGFSLFRIMETTGVVTLAGSLNFTELSTFYRLKINAMDGGGKCFFDETIYFSSVAFCNITVVDVPDLDPSFLGLPYIGRVEENSPVGQSVFKVTAVDQDTGVNDTIIYSIEDSTIDGLFTISDDGVISVLSPIDREEFDDTDTVTVTVKATESKQNIHGVYASAITDVLINITDVNDNKPEFYKCGFSCVKESHFTGEATENSSGFISINMTVRDLDKVSNTNLTLGGAEKDVFAVEPQFTTLDSIVQLVVRQPQKLDFEKTQQMTIEVIATDQYDTLFSSTATVTINIKDVNDNSPTFSQATFRLNVAEHSDVGTVVGNITATDADNPDTENSQIVYGIEESSYSDNFTIDPNTGVLRNSGELDREALDQALEGRIELNVTATDKGTPPLSASVTVIINVEDVNDNSPQFEAPSYEFFVKEGEKGAFVGSVTAEDLDQTTDFNRISFSIIDGSFGSFIMRTFAMERGYRGNITVDPDIELDYESERKQFKLRVEAGDPEQKTAEVMVVVNVVDVNDERPEFTAIKPITVKENTTISGAVGRFLAHDKDTIHHLVYELESMKCRCNSSPTTCSYFILLPTGEVTQNNELKVDYEQCDQVLIEAQVVDELTEKGENNSATTGQMVINIEDINDNAPGFIFSDFVYAAVLESASNGTSVANITAADRDSGINGQIEFKVTAVLFADSNQTTNMSMLFGADTIQKKDVYVGIIKTTEGLNAELKGKYLISVTATDTGGLFTSTVLEIFTVEKLNKVVLEFSSSEEEVKRNLSDIIRVLTAATNASVEIVSIRPVTVKTSKASGGTIIVAHFYLKGTTLTADHVEELISVPEYYYALKELGFEKIGSDEIEPSDTLIHILLGVFGGFVVLAVIVAALLMLIRRKRKLEEAKAINFALMGNSDNQRSGPFVPGTNKHTYEDVSSQRRIVNFRNPPMYFIQEEGIECHNIEPRGLSQQGYNNSAFNTAGVRRNLPRPLCAQSSC